MHTPRTCDQLGCHDPDAVADDSHTCTCQDTRARCVSRAGRGDSLHHADGTHRSTPANTRGRALERHAGALARHMATLPDVTR